MAFDAHRNGAPDYVDLALIATATVQLSNIHSADICSSSARVLQANKSNGNGLLDCPNCHLAATIWLPNEGRPPAAFQPNEFTEMSSLTSSNTSDSSKAIPGNNNAASAPTMFDSAPPIQ